MPQRRNKADEICRTEEEVVNLFIRPSLSYLY